MTGRILGLVWSALCVALGITALVGQPGNLPSWWGYVDIAAGIVWLLFVLLRMQGGS